MRITNVFPLDMMNATALNIWNIFLQNKQYKEEIFQLNSRTHQLSHELSELSSNHKACQSTIHLLNTKLVELESQKSHEATVAKQNQEASAALTKEHLQLQLAWQDEKVLLEEQLKASAKKVRLISTGACIDLCGTSLLRCCDTPLRNWWVDLYAEVARSKQHSIIFQRPEMWMMSKGLFCFNCDKDHDNVPWRFPWECPVQRKRGFRRLVEKILKGNVCYSLSCSGTRVAGSWCVLGSGYS